MKNGEIIEIRKIRHEISKKIGNDLNKLLEHYNKLEANLKTSGRYKFSEDKH
ncbi:MAG: hypothetical protein QM487_02560 [Candidatus Marithrix sp.]